MMKLKIIQTVHRSTIIMRTQLEGILCEITNHYRDMDRMFMQVKTVSDCVILSEFCKWFKFEERGVMFRLLLLFCRV